MLASRLLPVYVAFNEASLGLQTSQMTVVSGERRRDGGK